MIVSPSSGWSSEKCTSTCIQTYMQNHRIIQAGKDLRRSPVKLPLMEFLVGPGRHIQHQLCAIKVKPHFWIQIQAPPKII